LPILIGPKPPDSTRAYSTPIRLRPSFPLPLNIAKLFLAP